MTVLRIALAQLNPTVGDLDGNLAKLIEAYDRAEAAGCDIVAFPELSTTGYPPEDLVLKPGFVADNRVALDKFAAHTGECAAVVGFVDADRDLYNAAAVCVGGEIVGHVPQAAAARTTPCSTSSATSRPAPTTIRSSCTRSAASRSACRCARTSGRRSARSPTQAAGGAELNININGSPYHWEKDTGRERMVATRAQDAHSAIVYVNQVGGQDELVFDGGSFVVDAEGTCSPGRRSSSKT